MYRDTFCCSATPQLPLPTLISPLQTFVQSTTWRGEPCEVSMAPLKNMSCSKFIVNWPWKLNQVHCIMKKKQKKKNIKVTSTIVYQICNVNFKLSLTMFTNAQETSQNRCQTNHQNCSVQKTLVMHYNKRCPCTPSDFTKFWVNSLVLVNED